VLQLQRPQTVFNFSAQFRDTHAVLWLQFAGQRRSGLCPLALIETDTAILAILIPAEAPVGDLLRSQILKAAQQMVIFWYLKLLA